MSARIDIASIDGCCVDQRFGAVRYWQIYDVDGRGSFVETRKTKPGCSGHCEGGFGAQLGVLKDCDALFVCKIGEGVARAMLQAGKRAFEADGHVEELSRPSSCRIFCWRRKGGSSTYRKL